MQLENSEIQPGDIICYQEEIRSGIVKFKLGEVMEWNEHVQAVKLKIFGKTAEKWKPVWFPLAKLRRRAPGKAESN